MGGGSEFGFDIRGIKINYDVKANQLSCQGHNAVLKAVDGKVRFRILVDRTSIEIFGNDGEVYMPVGVIAEDDNVSVSVYAEGGAVNLSEASVYRLESAW